MKSLALRGTCLAVFGALTVGLGAAFGLDLDHVALLGVALGGVLGFLPDRALSWRIGGFVAGFAVAWAAYAMRASILPDTSSGRAVAIFGVLMVLVALTLVTRANLPIWSLLVGSAAMAGAYEQTYTASPTLFLTESPVAATTVLLAAAFGVIGSIVISGDKSTERQSVLGPRMYAGAVAVSGKKSVA